MDALRSDDELDASDGLPDDGHLPTEAPDRGEKTYLTKAPVLWTQVLAAVVAAMAHFSLGCGIAFSAVTLPELTKMNSTEIYLDPTNAAFFGSVLHLGSALGSFASCVLLVRFGQRTSLLISLPVTLVSWIVIAKSSSVLALHTSRFIQGLSNGVNAPAAYTLVIEIAFSKYRGRLSSIVDLFRSTGVFFVMATGALLTWRPLAIVCGVISIVPAFLGLLFLPNSPRWLASKRRYQEAEESLRFFRGRVFDITPEMNDIKTVVNSKKKDSLKTQLEHMRRWSSLKKFLILAFMSFAFQFSGHAIVTTFTVPIFMETKSGINPYMCGVLLGAVRVVGAVFYLLTADCCSRRLTFMCHSLISSVAMTCISVYFFLKLEIQDEELTSKISVLPLASLLTYAFSMCSALPNMFQHQRELLPLSFRAAGINILGAVFLCGTFIIVQGFPLMSAGLHLYGSFALFAGVCFLIAFYPLAFMSETRKKSLEEIEMALSKPKTSG